MSDLQRFIAQQSAESPEFTRLRAESQAEHDREVRFIRFCLDVLFGVQFLLGVMLYIVATLAIARM